MSKSKAPVTQAVRVLRRAKVAFDDHLYTYIEGGGTAQFAREKSVDEYLTIKTLIMEDDGHNPLIVLMHGDQQYCQASIADLPKIYINGGSRGYIISMHTIDMLNLLTPTLVDFPQRTGNDSANTETIEIG
jgi:prolyl-tRNA editing enzyme YbaK/EbsC (Cys-tRNA(Pro) deacylase)